MGTAAALGDRMAQMEAMDGAARCLEALRTQQKICNCRPLEFNTRLLEVASSVGAKLLVRKIRARLALIYRSLGDEEQYKTHDRLATQAEAALGLNCGGCNERVIRFIAAREVRFFFGCGVFTGREIVGPAHF